MSPAKPAAKKEIASAPVAEALGKNKKVAKDVKEAADELAVVHAVLDKRLPGDARDGDVATAVAQTDDLEKRLTESGKKLDDVNRSLEKSLSSL
jgi:hypothetical protein